jgi:hypothetical protein
MARSGDWITPRLVGRPWFEKPPLTYWLTAAGNLAHLPDEWAARLPEALISVAFLIFFYVSIAREFSPRLALAATSILATSAGWLAYSFAALTDLPMSAALGAAILITLCGKGGGFLAGALLGVSILGKGFVPVVLFAPVLWIARGKRFSILARTLAGAVLVATPWFVLCGLRNGSVFWDDFFWKQHIARFLSPSLAHAQPFWYYIPILLGGLFPWTPLAALLARRQLYADIRLRLLSLWLLYGLIFFSVARNKLPGYLLPLLPGLAILLAAAWESAPFKGWWLAACALLLIASPTAAALLPGALVTGLTHTAVSFVPGGLVFLAAVIAVYWLMEKGKTEAALLAVAVAAGLGFAYLKFTTFPALDADVSARGFWRSHRDAVATACLGDVNRTWQYGLEYYADREVPYCRDTGSAHGPHIAMRGQLVMEPDE